MECTGQQLRDAAQHEVGQFKVTIIFNLYFDCIQIDMYVGHL